MPFLGYVGDLVTLELHEIDVVGAGVASVRRYRTAWACMRSMEHTPYAATLFRFASVANDPTS
jgi:hypothetical protein